jgi:hypothetical protein
MISEPCAVEPLGDSQSLHLRFSEPLWVQLQSCATLAHAWTDGQTSTALSNRNLSLADY